MMRHIERYAAGAVILGYGAAYLLGRTAGSTARERAAALPGDDLVSRPNLVTNHAITIDAPPDAVWPWLSQMGWHLGGYYTPGWVDRLLFPGNWPSLERLDPALVRDLVVGDTIPDGPAGTAWYVVTKVDPPHTLVLHSTTHLPAAWRDRHGAGIDWTWTYHLTARPWRRTRLHVRVRGRTTPWWLTAAYHVALVPADLVMAVGMLRGIRKRAQAGLPWKPSGREPVSQHELPGRASVEGHLPAAVRRRRVPAHRAIRLWADGPAGDGLESGTWRRRCAVTVSLSPPPRRLHRLWARIALVAVEAFVAAGAVYGSIMLITDGWRLDPAMLRHLPVDAWVLPGVTLAALIAVPNVVAAVLVALGHARARVVSLFAGGILAGWIVVQITLIQQYFYLQPVMGVCGLLTIGLAYRLPAAGASS